MVLLLKKIWSGYFYVTNELADPRTKDWPLVGKPSHGLSILFLYLLFVLKIGPCWMKNRPPYNVDKAVIVFNVIQVLACSYVFFEGLWYAWGWEYQWLCEPVNYSNDYRSLRTAKFVYHYYLLKYLDLFDTVFFVLRKKDNQASFLHLFHHFNVVIMGWMGATLVPGGHGSFICLINSFVHIVMYLYYLLTISIPSVKQSIWWKKHITQLQIVQLSWCAFHMLAPLFKQDCNYPLIATCLFVPSDIFMLVLFSDFYYRTYVKKPTDKQHKKIKVMNTNEVNGSDVIDRSEFENLQNLKEERRNFQKF